MLPTEPVLERARPVARDKVVTPAVCYLTKVLDPYIDSFIILY